MLTAIRNSWALLFGMMLLMIGNGLQGTLLGVRGEIEGFSTLQMSFVMSAYFVGFLGGYFFGDSDDTHGLFILIFDDEGTVLDPFHFAIYTDNSKLLIRFIQGSTDQVRTDNILLIIRVHTLKPKHGILI